MNIRFIYPTLAILNLVFSIFLIIYLFEHLIMIQKKESLLVKNIKNYETFYNIYPFKRLANYSLSYNNLPYIYLITPTHKTETQLPDLIRFRNTIQLVPKLVWVIIEDSSTKTERIVKFLNESNVKYVHLNIKSRNHNRTGVSLHKGIPQRNHAINWFRNNKHLLYKNSVVYFADDDNTYDIRLFEEIRFTRKVSVWPVGLVGGIMYEKPICKNAKVIDWFWYYNLLRKFPIDMAGFGINLQLLLEKQNSYFTMLSKSYLEGAFVEEFVTQNELEGKADECTKVYVWHTRSYVKFDKNFKNSSIYDNLIKKQIV